MELYGRVATTVANEGLSPWSRDFARRVDSDPGLRKRLGGALLRDADGDGLPDAFETLMGLDPQNSDSDGGGRPDGVELPFAAPGVSDPAISDAVVPCVP